MMIYWLESLSSNNQIIIDSILEINGTITSWKLIGDTNKWHLVNHILYGSCNFWTKKRHNIWFHNPLIWFGSIRVTKSKMDKLCLSTWGIIMPLFAMVSIGCSENTKKSSWNTKCFYVQSAPVEKMSPSWGLSLSLALNTKQLCCCKKIGENLKKINLFDRVLQSCTSTCISPQYFTMKIAIRINIQLFSADKDHTTYWHLTHWPLGDFSDILDV